MGEANRRGSYEERKQQAIVVNELRKDAEEARRRELSQQNEEARRLEDERRAKQGLKPKRTARRAHMIMAMGMGLAAAAAYLQPSTTDTTGDQ